MDMLERFENSEGGEAALLRAEARYDVLSLLHRCLDESGMTQAQLAEVLGVRKSAVNAVFRGNGNLRIDTLAQYLAAMGRRLDVGAVPVPARRQRVMWSASLRGRVVAGRYDDRASRRKRDGGRYVVDLHTGRKANV